MEELKKTLNIEPKIKSSFFLYMTFIFILTFLDLISKYYLIWNFDFDTVIYQLLNGYFDIILTEHIDEKIIISSSDLDNYTMTMFVIASLIIVLSCTLTLNFDKFAKLCMALIISGGLGNFIDKLFSFNATNIMCSIQQSSNLHSVCFNIADFFIIFGVTFAFLYNIYFFLNIVIKKEKFRFALFFPFLIFIPYYMFAWLINSF